jgi:hypothetical protein
MNWTELRPLLRKHYGDKISFFNDKYRSGTRRVKIYGMDPNKIKRFIRKQDPNLIVNDYDWMYGGGIRTIKCVTIHFSE